MNLKDDNEDLISSLNQSLKEITEIQKCLGNENRLEILVLLLDKPKSYSFIVESLDLKKTAVSNHLTQLLETNLIEKIDYGVYNITGDGLEFLKAINNAFHNSPSRKLERFEAMQSRGLSESFLKRFDK
ncbi:MAG: hypothetical protein BAJALOKI3v1_250010 [Promethearchaeota archaeon]|jgi:DNA-binding transcriptional ArsR family regulator|nr:MAG: hypothetical protein BAJALOKI3v1_250010 [Candidatus Lokiarchaeota archaeon]